MTTTFGDPRLPARFWTKVAHDPDGCWLWTAAKNHGYGYFLWNGRTQNAHRVAYEVLVDAVPDGLVVDHGCHNGTGCPGGIECPHRPCVRPDHLEAVTQSINKLRGMSAPARKARQTHCKRGHELASDNVKTNKRGHRECYTCRLAQNARWRERRRHVSPPQRIL